MEENKKFYAELEIVRFEDVDVITESCPFDNLFCPTECVAYCESDGAE